MSLERRSRDTSRSVKASSSAVGPRTWTRRSDGPVRRLARLGRDEPLDEVECGLRAAPNGRHRSSTEPRRVAPYSPCSSRSSSSETELMQ